MKAIIFFSALDDNTGTRTSHCTNTAAGLSHGNTSADNIKPPFWKLSAPEIDPSRRHCFTPPGFFVPASPSFSFFGLRWKEIMQMEMGTRRKKCWHLLSSPPLNTHTHLTHPIQGVFCWPALVALSLLAVSQAHFNNRSHVARALSFLLFRSGPFHSDGTGAQTDRRNSSSSVQANRVGLFNFGRLLSVAACYFEEKLPLIGSFDEATCSHI